MTKRLLLAAVLVLQASFGVACSQDAHSQAGWLPSAATRAAEKPRAKLTYEIVSLPAGFAAVALNNHDVVLGYLHGAVVYRRGSMTALPALPHDNVVNVSSINDRGTVVGESGNQSSAEPARPVVWERGKPHPLRTAPPGNYGPFISNSADLINDRGQIVGSANAHLGYGYYPEFLGTISFYSKSQLPQAVTGCCGQANSLDNHGQVAGYEQLGTVPPENFGFLSPGLKGCTSNGTAGLQNTSYFGLNEKGHVIAQFNGGTTSSEGAVYLFCQGSTVSTLAGTPAAVNDRDYVVGSLGSYAYLRTPYGHYYNVNSLLPPGSPAIVKAVAINDKGVILAGTATVWYLLVPAASCDYLFK